MRRFGILFILLASLLRAAFAVELLKDGKSVELEKGALVMPTATLSGYPLYGGDGGWKFISASSGESGALGTAESVNVVRLNLDQVEPDGSWFAFVSLLVNATSVGGHQYTTGAPCKGEFTYVVDKSLGLYDNCQTFKVVSYKAGTTDKVYFSLRFTHTATAGRRLIMELRLNPELLGFRKTNTNSWATEAVAQNPTKQKFIERLKQFGTKLQDANQVALGFDKPKDAYYSVPSYRTLLDVPHDLADGTFTQLFISAVEHEKNAPDFKAIAYSKWGGNRVAWNYADEQESQAIAESIVLENCNKNRRTDGSPCTLYDLKVHPSLVKPVVRNVASIPSFISND